MCARAFRMCLHQHRCERRFQGLNFCSEKGKEQNRCRCKNSPNGIFGNERSRGAAAILHSIIQSHGRMAQKGRDDIMPGIQLIKFSFFELLSANFTRFASVHFRVLHGFGAWISRSWSEKLPRAESGSGSGLLVCVRRMSRQELITRDWKCN